LKGPSTDSMLKTVSCVRVVRAVWREPEVGFLALRMASWVCVLTALARLCSMPRAFRLITPVGRGLFACETRLTPARLAAVLDAILRIDVAAFTPICWKRAAILYRYLRLSGREPHILFGTQKRGNRVLAAHAWVEVDGIAMFEATRPDFVVVYRFPSFFQQTKQDEQP
jgi:Transglutaminase-like superfamily